MKLKDNIVPVLLGMVVFFQNPIWPLWRVNSYLSFMTILLLTIVCLRNKRKMNSRSSIAFFVMLTYFCLFHYLFGVQLGYFFYIISFYCVSITSYEERYTTLEYVSKVFGTILLVSLISWMLHVFSVVNIPMIGILDNSSMLLSK